MVAITEGLRLVSVGELKSLNKTPLGGCRSQGSCVVEMPDFGGFFAIVSLADILEWSRGGHVSLYFQT